MGGPPRPGAWSDGAPTTRTAGRSPLRIEVITRWRDQAVLAPFFLDHYRYADRIHVLVDARTADDTLAICARYPSVAVTTVPAADPGGAPRVAELLNATYRALRCDWVYAVDGDQLLFPLPWGTNPRPAMNLEHDFDVVRVRLWQVHRHRTEVDLDPRRPAVPQRRHGVPHPVDGSAGPPARPMVVRGGLGGAWSGDGLAFEAPGLRISPRVFGGADWSRADLAPGPERERHLDDPRVF